MNLDISHIFIITGLVVQVSLVIFWFTTVRKKLQEASLKKALDILEEKEKTLSLIYENTNDFIALLKKEGDQLTIIRLPETFIQSIEQHTRFLEKEVLGKPIYFLYDKVLELTQEERAFRFDKINTLFETKATVKYEEQFKAPDGHRGLSQSSLIPILKGNEIEYVLYVAQDITEERSTNLQLEYAVDVLERVYESNLAAIVLFKDGKIEKVNKRFTSYFGYEQEEIIGETAEKFIPEKYWHLLNDVRKDLYEKGEELHFGREREIVTKRKDGSLFYCECVISPLLIQGVKYSFMFIVDVSDYYNAQKELLASREQLQSIIDNLPGMLFRLGTDEEFTLQHISGNSEKYLGITQEDIEKYNIKGRDVLSDEFIQYSRSVIKETFEKQEPGEMKLPIEYKGTSKWVSIRFKPTQLSNGEYVIDGLLFDVTNQVENEERLSLAIESAREGLWDWNIEDGKLVFNNYQAEMLGYDVAEMSNDVQEFFKNIHPQDIEDAQTKLSAHLKEETDFYETEYRIKTKNGVYKWLLVHGKVISRMRDGKALRVIGTHVDIDERKKAEIAVRKSQERLLTLMSNIPGMVYRGSYEDNYALSFVSNGSMQLTGYSPEDFVKGKRTIFELIKDSDKEKINKEVQSAVSEKRAYQLVYEINSPAGSKWVYDKGQEVGNGYLEGFITDITDRVHAEERIIQTIIETEDRERSRIAKELHDSLGQKLTTVSLNFNALKSKVDKGSDVEDRLMIGLEYLKQAIGETREISHNLMPKSIEDFGVILSIESLIADLNEYSETAFSFYHNIKDNALSNNIGIHLYRIVQESINNILKHAKAKTVTVQLMAYEDIIVLSIEDDGKGFNIGSNDKSQSFGLDSIRHRAQLLSGDAIIDSSAGHGTTITVEIPTKKHYFHEEN
jgi:PAS domain S-box-containing protein